MEVGSEMSKGERMRAHTERTEGDDFSVRNSSAKGENENSTHCVLNLERGLRFITHRVMNFSRGLETPQKTSASQFGTRCVPNLEGDSTIKIYPEKRIAEFDQAEVELAAKIERGIRELEGMLK